MKLNEQTTLNNETHSSESDHGQFLMEFEGGELLKTFGLPVAEGELVINKTEALRLADKLGYPLVLKGMSPQIIHKTEAGIVKLNIQNEVELAKKFDEIIENVYRHSPQATLAGVLVQKMVPNGLELIIGIKKDSVFGHQLIIGMGGIFVELLKDFAIKMMPVTDDEVEEMIQKLKSFPLLNGYRGGGKINRDHLKQIVQGLNKVVQERPEIEELDLNPVMFFDNEVAICDVRIMLGESETTSASSLREVENVQKMINPTSIAVVGASTNEKKNGGRLFRYIVENGYSGELYPINPKAEEIKGYKAYPALKDIPGNVDLACVIVPATQVPEVLRECIFKGVKAAIIYSSGFAEIGEEGKKLQDEICELAVQGNIRLVGPNSIGIASPLQNVYTAFGAALETSNKVQGNIGFISQSGAMGSALLSRAWEQGAGFSRWISVGNEADLTTSDFINVLAEDESTKVISVFMESIKNVDSFKQATLNALKNKKPVLIYKTGKSVVGKRAVQSHTGSIAGDDSVYSAAFDKLGVLRIENIEELIDVSRAFTVQPNPKGKRIGVITASGGACSVVADLCSEYGLDVPELQGTAETIKQLIPPFGSARNPIDVTAEVIAKPEMFKKVLSTLVEDSDVDGVIIMLTSNADPGASVIAQSILDVFNSTDKPIVVGRLGADMIAPKAMALYQQEKFPVYPTPERVVRVMHYLVKYSEILKKVLK